MNTNTLHTIPDNAKKVRFTYTKQLKNNMTEASERELLLGEEVIIPLLRGGEGWGEEAEIGIIEIPSPRPSPRLGGARE